MKNPILAVLVFISSLLAFCTAKASHIVGGEVSYVYLGDSMASGTVFQKYRVSLSIYEDCLNGNPQAIAQDNPAFLGAFDAVTGATYAIDSDVNFSSSITVPFLYLLNGPCGPSLPSNVSGCLLKKTFIKNYAFPANAHGYVVSYERCCRNAAIVNVVDPGSEGCTYYCTIPPTTIVNNSAVFKNYPPQVICLNFPLFYDNSADDADNDSLSYGFCAALQGANDQDIKPIPYFPTWDSVAYVTPAFSSQTPIAGAPAIKIDPVTGMITGTPNLVGRYLVNVCCYEWRGGVLINTVRREFQFVVTDCGSENYRPLAGPDTIVITGAYVNFYASLGTTYSWTPTTYLSNPNIANPVGHFTDPGHYTYTVHSISDSGCDGSTTVNIWVLDFSSIIVPSGFTPNGDGHNDYLKPIPVLGSTLVSFKVFNRKGNLVYNGGPNDPGWDGNYNNIAQDVGTYYWEAIFYDSSGASQRARGDVTLVR